MDRRVVVTAAGAVAVLVSVQVLRWICRHRKRPGHSNEVSFTLQSSRPLLLGPVLTFKHGEQTSPSTAETSGFQPSCPSSAQGLNGEAANSGSEAGDQPSSAVSSCDSSAGELSVSASQFSASSSSSGQSQPAEGSRHPQIPWPSTEPADTTSKASGDVHILSRLSRTL